MKISNILVGFVFLASLAFAIQYSAFKTQDYIYLNITNNDNNSHSFDYRIGADFNNGSYADFSHLVLASGESKLIQIPRGGILENLSFYRLDVTGNWVLDFTTDESGLLVHDLSVSAWFDQDSRIVVVNVTNKGDFQENFVLEAYSGNQEIDELEMNLAPGQSKELGLQVPAGNYSILANIDYDYDSGDNQANITVPSIVDLAVSARQEDNEIIINLENLGTKGSYFEILINSNIWKTGFLDYNGSMEFEYKPTHSGDYEIKVLANSDSNLENNLAIVHFNLSDGLGIEDIFIKDGRVHVIVYNEISENLETEFYLVLDYASGEKEYDVNVTLDLGDNDLSATLESGFLVQVIAKVDPDNEITGWNNEKEKTLLVNQEVDTSPPVIELISKCDQIRAGDECSIMARISDQNLAGYKISYNLGNETKEEKFYALANEEILNYTFKPRTPGVANFTILAWDKSGNEANETFQIEVGTPRFNGQSMQIPEIVKYDLGPVLVWRDYYYNQETRKTLIKTHILAKTGINAIFKDSIPPTIALPSQVYIYPSPEKDSSKPSWYLNLSQGDEFVLYYVVSKPVSPDLVKEYPEPGITILHEEKPVLESKREYELGNLNITRVWKYLPESDMTFIATVIYGLDENKTWNITDLVPGDSGFELIPEPDFLEGRDASWIVNGAQLFGYEMKIKGYLPPETLDKMDLPRVEEVKQEGEKGEKEEKKEKPSPITGLLTMVKEGAKIYASLIVLAGILALIVISIEKGFLPEAGPELEEGIGGVEDVWSV